MENLRHGNEIPIARSRPHSTCSTITGGNDARHETGFELKLFFIGNESVVERFGFRRWLKRNRSEGVEARRNPNVIR
jgi:hypothetical protein